MSTSTHEVPTAQMPSILERRTEYLAIAGCSAATLLVLGVVVVVTVEAGSGAAGTGALVGGILVRQLLLWLTVLALLEFVVPSAERRRRLVYSISAAALVAMGEALARSALSGRSPVGPSAVSDLVGNIAVALAFALAVAIGTVLGMALTRRRLGRR
jgi:hypothetical protein